MHVQPVRTTILIQPSLLKRLKLFSQEQGKPASEIIEQAVRQVINNDDKVRLERMYQGLFALAGTGKKSVTNASGTVDQTLYGKAGVWKGADE